MFLLEPGHLDPSPLQKWQACVQWSVTLGDMQVLSAVGPQQNVAYSPVALGPTLFIVLVMMDTRQMLGCGPCLLMLPLPLGKQSCKTEAGHARQYVIKCLGGNFKI